MQEISKKGAKIMENIIFFVLIGALILWIIYLIRKMRLMKLDHDILKQKNNGLEKKVKYMRGRLPYPVQEDLELARFKQELENIKKEAESNQEIKQEIIVESNKNSNRNSNNTDLFESDDTHE